MKHRAVSIKSLSQRIRSRSTSLRKERLLRIAFWRQVESYHYRRDLFFWICATLVLLWLAYSFLLHEKGLVKFLHLLEVKKQLEKDITSLSQKNEEARKEIEKLKYDPFFIERAAREEYGLARPGELIFRFEKDVRRKE